MLLNTLQCTGKPLNLRIIQLKMSVVASVVLHSVILALRRLRQEDFSFEQMQIWAIW
jgi:hypothetical protein